MTEQLENIMRPMLKPTVYIGSVTSIDESNWTITVKANKDGLEYDEVKLLSVAGDLNTGIFIKPKIDSVVLFGIIEGIKENMFVIKYGEIDSIKFLSSDIQLNGDSNGGLIKINDLKTQWDANVTSIKAACVAAFTALSVIDSSASLNAFNAAANTIKNLNKSSLENTSVKHG